MLGHQQTEAQPHISIFSLLSPTIRSCQEQHNMAPIIEEIRDDEDIDNMDFDPADFDPRNPFARSNMTDGRPMLIPTSEEPAQSSSSRQQQTSPFEPSRNDERVKLMNPPGLPNTPFIQNEQDMEAFKDWQVIYPVYFDINKSRSEGRRVTKSLAVENPLAENMLLALRTLGVKSVFETTKTHPKDWSNPGRIRVDLVSGDTDVPIKNKSHLYRLVGEYLKKHPTTRDMVFKSPVYHQIRMQVGDVKIEPEPLAVPRGWKINSILPVSSRAISGGEATEEMMQQMQNQMMPGLNQKLPPEPKMKKMKIKMGR